MIERCRKIELDEYEQGIMINALNLLRSMQIRDSRPTDPVDELLMKVIESGPKKLMVSEKGAAYDCSR